MKIQEEMITVLVFPCASGVGQEIYYALENHKDIKLFGANAGNMNPGKILFGSTYIGDAPPMSQYEECISWLNIVFKTHKIDCIFPAYDDAQVWLKTNESKFNGVRVLTSSIETTLICRSKKRTYELLSNIIRCPKLYDSVIEYPVFIKPECGEGSKGCLIIGSEEELKNSLKSEHLVCEYLPGEEYTVDCFSDSAGTLRFVGPRIRHLTRAGISILTETVSDTQQEFYIMARKINEAMKFIGAWFFQVKRTRTGEIGLMEIAPRIAGAMFLYREQGVNFPLLSIYAHMGYPIQIINPRLDSVVGCKLYRNYFYIPQLEENPIAALYVDLDDTLLLPMSKKANPSILSLLYESKKAEIPVFLLTRHKGILDETLDTACIHKSIFKEIIHITNNNSKKNFIVNRPALFIDDSFTERASCAADDIYVFDVDSYELIRDCIRFRTTHE